MSTSRAAQASSPGSTSPLTLLTTTKPFAGHFDVIQRNALESWTRLDPRPEVIVFGDDAGAREVCSKLGLHHVPDVATTPEGTPLVSSMFIRGQALARTPVVCWSNADVIFTDRIVGAAAIVARRPRPSYLVGQRTDLDQTDPMDFGSGWQARLVERARREGEVKPLNWIDYFMFTRGLFPTLPDFAIGRPGYDPWLIWRAADLGAEVIDATPFNLAVHQRHDYAHVGSRKLAFTGPEAQRNAAIVDDWRHYHSIAYARLVLGEDGEVRPATAPKYRVARPRTYLAHVLRFTRPLRRRMLGERATRRLMQRRPS